MATRTAKATKRPTAKKPVRGPVPARRAAPSRAADAMITMQVPASLQQWVVEAANSERVRKHVADALAVSEPLPSVRSLASIRAREQTIRKIRDSYQLLTSSEFAKNAGSRSANPSEYASSKARAWTAIALRLAGNLAFPGFQFDPRTGKPYQQLQPVFEVFRKAGWDQESVVLWFMGPSSRLHGQEPAAVITSDLAAVVDAALDAAAPW